VRSKSEDRWFSRWHGPLSASGLLVRLLAPYLFTLVAIALALYAYSNRVVEDFYVDTLSENVLRQARLAGNLLPWDMSGPPMDQRCAAIGAEIGARVTVIAADGTVLGDSDAPSVKLENHGHRPEVRAALATGEGQAVRTSVSVNRQLFYRAWRQTRARDDDSEQRVVRLSVPMRSIEEGRGHIGAAIWGGVGLAALAALWPALLLSGRLSRRVARLTEFSSSVAAGVTPPALAPEHADIIGRLEANLLAMAGSLKAQLQAARAEQAKLEAVLSGMLEGVLVIDSAGTIRLANHRAEQLFQRWPGRSLVGQPLIDVSRDPDLHSLVHEITRGQASGRLGREITLASATGAEYLQVSATPMRQLDGEAPLFILVFHDITALKKLEATRRDFVANVSHELRTPLTAIRGYAETLRAGALADAEQADNFLAIIERHSERLTRLTEDLLTLSDLELGRAPIKPVPMALERAVEAAMDVVRDKAVQAGLELHSELAPDLPQVDADPDRIEQVLVNLIDNAVKFTPAGGRVTISASATEPAQRDGTAPETASTSAAGLHPPQGSTLRRAPEDGSAERVRGAGRWVTVCVADTGVGVPKHHLQRLTERFYRVDQARSRELGGTGLGLAIVKHIVHAHGGTLRIESEVGRGTQVYVSLPAAPPESEAS
jgi:two-component system phosphate regulon sensor histidine kinase PhoR